MEIQVNIISADFTKDSSWFVQVELEQQSFPSKEKTKQKQRTEIIQGSTGKFEKNYFIFKCSLSNRLSIKFGAIESLDFNQTQKLNPSKCTCEGIYTIIITKRLLAALRDQVPIKEAYKLLNPKNNQETCLLSASIALNCYGIEEKIIENERVFFKIEYDRYEKDPDIIKEKEKQVQELLNTKSKELSEWIDKVDNVKNALRSLGTDIAMLKREKDELEQENKEHIKIINRLSNVDDIHIKVDMLSTSPHGIEILKLMMEKTDNRLKLQRAIYQELTQNWMKIEGKKRKLELLKEEVRKVKDAQSQLQFHMLTLRDQLPQSLVLRDNVKTLDKLIQEFEKQISKARNVKRDKATEVEVVTLKHKHVLLKEKYKQIQILIDTNQGFLPMEELEKLQIEQYDPDTETDALKKKGEMLLKEIEDLGAQFSQESFKPKSYTNSIEIQVKLQAAEARVAAMQEKMTQYATAHAKEIAGYEAQLAELDARINQSL